MEVGIGIVGLGFMGMTHFEAIKRVEGARVRAIATRSEKKRRGDWSDIQGNFGPRGNADNDLSDIHRYAELEELLADPDVDLVHICLPTDQHEQATIQALNAGKHVLVEKPIATELDAAQRMVQAAESAGKLLMVAHVLPYFPEFRWILEAVQSGRYGRLLAGSFRLQNHPTGQVAILRGTENHTRSPTPPAQVSRSAAMYRW